MQGLCPARWAISIAVPFVTLGRTGRAFMRKTTFCLLPGVGADTAPLHRTVRIPVALCHAWAHRPCALRKRFLAFTWGGRGSLLRRSSRRLRRLDAAPLHGAVRISVALCHAWAHRPCTPTEWFWLFAWDGRGMPRPYMGPSEYPLPYAMRGRTGRAPLWGRAVAFTSRLFDS